ncbi:MAG: M56 family metallopeptidase [Mycobacteriales bacterium]
MTALSLLGLAVVLMLGGAQLRRVRLFDALPRVGVLAWQVLSLAALASVALAGATLIVPSSDLGHGLATFLRACIYTVQAAYSAPTQFPAVTAGVLLAAASTLWPAGWVSAHLMAAYRERRRSRDALALVSRDDAVLGATLVDADVAAAYCLPGRHGRIVLTTAAVAALDEDELAAVIAHERAHLRERHHLVVGAASGVVRAFPGVPLFATAASEIARLVELCADDAAARDTDQISVAAALVTLAGMRAPRAALAAADRGGAARVSRLLGPVAPVGIARPIAALCGLTVVLLAPAVLAAYPALAAAGADVCTVPSISA